MTLDEAIEHCKQKVDELSVCNKDCSLEHKQLFIWLSELKAIKENSYEDSMFVINKFTHNTNMKNLWHDINKIGSWMELHSALRKKTTANNSIVVLSLYAVIWV